MVIPGEASSPVELMPPPPPSRTASPPITMRGRSQTQLHDFSFPVLKTWGNQRFLRCVNVGKKGERVGPAAFSSPCSRPLPNSGSTVGSGEKAGRGGGEGMDEVREKLTVHIGEAAVRVGVEARDEETEVPASPSASAAPAVPSVEAAVVERPWSLRRRKPSCSNGFSPSSTIPRSVQPRSVQPPPAAEGEIPTMSLRSRPEKRERDRRPKFSVSLSHEEIEEDLFAVTGRRPPRRPKKRPRIIQRQLDMLFPGLWLTEVTTDSYRVPDPPPDSGKR